MKKKSSSTSTTSSDDTNINYEELTNNIINKFETSLNDNNFVYSCIYLHFLLTNLTDFLEINPDFKLTFAYVYLNISYLKKDLQLNASSSNTKVKFHKILIKLLPNFLNQWKDWYENLKIDDRIFLFHHYEQHWYLTKIKDKSNNFDINEIENNIKNNDNNILINNKNKKSIKNQNDNIIIDANANLSLKYIGWNSNHDNTINPTQYLIFPEEFYTLFSTPKKKNYKKTEYYLTENNIQDNNTESNSNNENNIININSSSNSNIKKNDNEDLILTGKRKRVTLQVSSTNIPKKDIKKDNKSKKKLDTDDSDQFDWVCSICGQLEDTNGSLLALCEGKCKKSFHINCMNEEDRKSFEKNEIWQCYDCETMTHLCFICNERGYDDIDVFNCKNSTCGKFYHAKCLEKCTDVIPPIKVKTKELLITDKTEMNKFFNLALTSSTTSLLTSSLTTSSTTSSSVSTSSALSPSRSFTSEEFVFYFPNNESLSPKELKMISPNPKYSLETCLFVNLSNKIFICPRHQCNTCSHFHGIVDRSQLETCEYCYRSFHINCIPPGSRFNSACLICPQHPDKSLPGVAIQKKVESNGQMDLDDDIINLKDLSSISSILSTSFPQVNLFYEQLTIPDLPPTNAPTDVGHFRFPVHLIEEASQIAPSFKIIKSNNYDKLPKEKLSLLNVTSDRDSLICNCTTICSDDCENRYERIECFGGKKDDEEIVNITASLAKFCNCLLGSNCSNRALQRRDYPSTSIIKEGNMGNGLKTNEFIKKGRLVLEYVGEVITTDQMRERMENQRKLTPHDHDYYIMELQKGFYVDGKYEGSVSRYINHSCDPNCELQRWNVKGKIRIGIFAIRDIQPNEPLSYDYRFDTREQEIFKCYCGAAKCRGTMAPKKSKNEEIDSKNKKKYDIIDESDDENLKKRWKNQSLTGPTLPESFSPITKGPVDVEYFKDHRLGLKRNFKKGSNFYRRKQLIIKKRQSKLIQ